MRFGHPTKSDVWYNWFAWRPVRAADPNSDHVSWVWLEWVERKTKLSPSLVLPNVWEYRTK